MDFNKNILRRPISLSSANPLTSLSYLSINDLIGFHKCPWQGIKSETEPESVFALAKRSYKVYENMGHISRTMILFAVVLDTGAGSGFIRLHELPEL